MLSQKKIMLGCLLLGVISSVTAGNVLSNENFDQGFTVGTLTSGSGVFANGNWILDADVNSYFITKDKK